MKNISLYSGRFSLIELAGYLILPLPWLPDLLRGSAPPYSSFDIAVKIILDAGIVVFLAFLRDVRKKINSLDVLKQDLSMAAIHDLKGPLTSIIGAVSLISEPDMDPVTKERLLKVAAESSQSMVKLIQTLVDTERMEIAKMRLQPEEFDLRPHITDCLGPFNSVSADMGVKLTLLVEDGMPSIRADKELLGRVFENLVMNAFKYSRRGGEILVGARFSEGDFHFEVKDGGTGISAEFIDKVFDKYYRVEGREQDSRKGSGLGLYFCRLAIEAHGGTIAIESKKGEGTRVLFDIPQGTVPDAAKRRRAQDRSPRISSGSPVQRNGPLSENGHQAGTMLKTTRAAASGRTKARLTAGACICAMGCALLLFTAAWCPAEEGPAEAAVSQRLSSQGERELRGIIAAGSLETLQRPAFAEYQNEIGEFYRSGGYTLAWVGESGPTAKARAVIKLLETAYEEGLPAQDYDSSLWAERLAGLKVPDSPAAESAVLRFDLALTVCAMRYILDLHLGRINPQLSAPALDVEPDVRDPSEYLRKRVVSADDVAAAFRALEPPFRAYRRLVDAVHRYEEMARRDEGGKLPAADIPVRPGKSYSGLPRLARLLNMLGDLPELPDPVPPRYTRQLVKAVKRFQRRHGLAPDGILDERTFRQLNTPLDQRLAQLRLTLERWRWLPHRFPRPPIIINIPEFRLYAGETPPQNVVVGMAFEHQTPVFASRLTEVVFRPPWNVPMSIQLGELAPAIEKDPGYLKEHDFEVVDGGGFVVSSGTVGAEVLARLKEGRLYLRQKPGPNNSLGLVKFMMPNPHSVYLHGTPSRRGFRESRRDFSHSCIRVEDPEALAAWVLRDRPEWTPKLIRAAIRGTETVTVTLTEQIPVFLQYGTAAVEEDGEVRFYDDIYERDAAEASAFEQRSRLAAR